MRKFIKLSTEAQNAAKWQAQRGYDGSEGTPLPVGLSVKACAEIAENQIAFRLAVHMSKSF